MIYYFCGHRGSGKNFLANQIASKVPIQIVDTGPLIRNAYRRYNSQNKTFREWLEYNEAKYGSDFTNKIICMEAKINPSQDCIVIGYRSLEGIEYFCDFFKIKQFKIIFIDGDYSLFLKNYNQREQSESSSEEYKRIVDVENSMGIQELRNYAKSNKGLARYYYKIENNDTIYNELIRDIEKDRDEGER